MFNGLVRSYLNGDYWLLRWNKRVKSLILEMWYTPSVFVPYLAILMLLKMMFSDSFKMGLVTLIPFALMMIVLLNKDFFGGQSVVHRKLGYKVLDARTNKTASKMQCLVRNPDRTNVANRSNFYSSKPQKATGDIIAGTILADVPTCDPELILTEIKESTFDKQTKLTLLISVACMVIFLIPSYLRS